MSRISMLFVSEDKASKGLVYVCCTSDRTETRDDQTEYVGKIAPLNSNAQEAIVCILCDFNASRGSNIFKISYIYNVKSYGIIQSPSYLVK